MNYSIVDNNMEDREKFYFGLIQMKCAIQSCAFGGH